MTTEHKPHSDLLTTIREESALLADWAEEGGCSSVDADAIRSRLMDAAENLVEQYEGALATIETLESKEELSAIIRSQTEEIESLSEQLEAARDVLRGIAENGACASDSRVADEYLRSSTGAGGGDGHLPHHPYPAKRPS